MKLLHEHALPATIYRVGEAEKRLKELESKVETLTQIIASVRADSMVSKEISQKVLPTFEIPKDLMMTRSARNGSKRGNRKHEVVKKRWAFWKTQYDAGLTISEIAHQWGCDHGSVCYAKARKWNPSKHIPPAHVMEKLKEYNENKSRRN